MHVKHRRGRHLYDPGPVPDCPGLKHSTGCGRIYGQKLVANLASVMSWNEQTRAVKRQIILCSTDEHNVFFDVVIGNTFDATNPEWPSQYCLYQIFAKENPFFECLQATNSIIPYFGVTDWRKCSAFPPHICRTGIADVLSSHCVCGMSKC